MSSFFQFCALQWHRVIFSKCSFWDSKFLLFITTNHKKYVNKILLNISLIYVFSIYSCRRMLQSKHLQTHTNAIEYLQRNSQNHIHARDIQKMNLIYCIFDSSAKKLKVNPPLMTRLIAQYFGHNKNSRFKS